jgi:ABC-type lipoprotein export system ATPase subunit
VDLDVGEGEMVAVVGRSGAGKTTLLNIIGGLDSRYEGSVEVAGQALVGLDDRALSAFRRRTVGFVFQAYNLLEQLTVLENVTLPRLLSDPGGREPRRRADRLGLEVLDSVGLADRAGDRPGALSGGERQRVAIARALFSGAPLLLCDEPTGNLDEETGAEVVGFLREVHSRGGVTVVVATHDRAVSAHAGRVLELARGTLAEAASAGGGNQ